MFLTDGLVYLAAKPTSCWTNNEERGGRKNGVWERTQDAIYIFIYASVGFFFQYCICGRLRIGEKMELWGFIYEESSKRRLLNLPPETLRLVITLICTDIMGSRATEWMELLGYKSFVRRSVHQALAVVFHWEKLTRFRLYKVLFSRFYACVWNDRSCHWASSLSELLC